MNHLLIGTADKTKRLLDLARDGFLLIDDGPIDAVFNGTVLDFSSEKPPRFNILKAASDHDKFTKDFTTLLDVVFPEGATTLTRGQSNYLLQNCVRLLLLAHHDTLLDLPRLLLDERYRAKLLSRCDDPVVTENWRDIAKWDTKDYRLTLQKISGLLMSPLLRRRCDAPQFLRSLHARRGQITR